MAELSISFDSWFGLPHTELEHVIDEGLAALHVRGLRGGGVQYAQADNLFTFTVTEAPLEFRTYEMGNALEDFGVIVRGGTLQVQSRSAAHSSFVLTLSVEVDDAFVDQVASSFDAQWHDDADHAAHVTAARQDIIDTLKYEPDNVFDAILGASPTYATWLNGTPTGGTGPGLKKFFQTPRYRGEDGLA